MTPPKRDSRKDLCDELAAALVTPGALRTIRLLQTTDILSGAPSPASRVAEQEPDEEHEADATPVGIWRPQEVDGALEWVRPPPVANEDSWSTRERIGAKREGEQRICLLGESVAVGALYSPELRFASMLSAHLHALTSDGRYDVIDLARVGIAPTELIEMTAACLQLDPDVIVVFAGNNWTLGTGHSLNDDMARAEALRHGGAAGLIAMAHDGCAEVVDAVISDLAAIEEAAEVPVVFVLPETNLADWRRSIPVTWLDGDGSTQWHSTFQEGVAALQAGDSARAEALAKVLISRDGGLCSASWRLLGDAQREQGHEDEAREAFVREIEASAGLVWERSRHLSDIPGIPRVMQQSIRRAAKAVDLRLVDLPAALHEHANCALPDRELFLDYCHLTASALNVVAACVAEQLVTAAGHVPERTVAAAIEQRPFGVVPPHVESKAFFQAALHAHHRDAPLDPRDHSRVRWWLERAVERDPQILDAMADVLAARLSPIRPILTEACARVDGSPYALPMGAWVRPTLDAPLVTLVAELLEEHRGTEAADALRNKALDHHDVCARRIDLLAPYYLGNRYQYYPPTPERPAVKQLFRALWPTSLFWFVASGDDSVVCSVVARLCHESAPSELRVSVNDVSCGTVPVQREWSRHAVPVPKDLLRRGMNEMVLSWPQLAAVGEAALENARTRLQAGLSADLWPLFGEVSSLHLGPS